jgi:hypothetical protein
VRYVLSVIAIGLLMAVSRMITVEGKSNTPKFVLMRLEDIGPGGQYSTLEQLGKLRTVFEFLQKNHVAYHLAVIPRWINLSEDGSRYDVSLDQTDNPYVEAFDKLLKQAVREGAVLGMHGYTHQIGNVRRDDGQHESGIGNEFNVPGNEETMTAAFAFSRMQEGLSILNRAGFHPAFWESPHYRSTPEQDAMFRNYFGLHYQAEVQNHRNAPAAVYMNGRNFGYGVPTLGAAYVPTPFDYIAYNKDEKVIIDRLGKSNTIGSFFYHPFLEFKHLIPVVDSDGYPVIRDGLPEFTYPAQNKTNLQKLIAGLNSKGYRFYSIHDYVPFTPAHSIAVGSEKETKLAIGDVNGDRQADIVKWNTSNGEISVIPCDFNRLRNADQPAPQVWGNIPYADGASIALGDSGRNGLHDLYVLQPYGELKLYVSDGSRFVFSRSWKVPAETWVNMTVQRESDGDMLLAGFSRDRTQLKGILLSQMQAKPVKPFKFKSEVMAAPIVHKLNEETGGIFIPRKDGVTGLELWVDSETMQWKLKKLEFNIPNENGEILFGDFNGDGKEDILRRDASSMRYTVYLQTENSEYRLLSTFGPWGKEGQRLIIADFDGNGKADLGITGNKDPYLDVALSYESSHLY